MCGKKKCYNNPRPAFDHSPSVSTDYRCFLCLRRTLASRLDDEFSSALQIASVAQMATGPIGRAGGADEVAGAAVVGNLAVRHVTERLAVEGVTENCNCTDIAGINTVLHGIVDNHGTLRVPAKNELSLRALLHRRLGKLHHFWTSRSTKLSIAGSAGGVVDALDGDCVLACDVVEILRKAWANNGAHCANLGSATGEDESQITASSVVRNVVGSRTTGVGGGGSIGIAAAAARAFARAAVGGGRRGSS